MTKDEAKLLCEHYTTLIDKLMAARIALIDGGVQSYTIDGRSLTKFDIDKLSKEIDDAVKKRDEYRALANGARPRKAFGIIPRDF
ncbi:MAG: hypothetical protein IKJ91_00080 [Clostridia bacterium]|nr:hypothetical protein [Clostridia bacterium]